MVALISRSPIIALCFVAAGSTVTNAETVRVGKPSDGSFVVAQTSGMERRQDRRANRQDCRQKEGLIGKDKRDCKQEGRADDSADATKKAVEEGTKQVTGQ
jgi:hypothetical protein